MLAGIVGISGLVTWILVHLARGGVIAAEREWRATIGSALVERPVADADFLHALRALYRRTSLMAYMCGAAFVGFGAATVHWSNIGAGDRIAAGALFLLAFALPMVFAARPVAAAYARARGIPRGQLRSPRMIALRLILVAMWVWPFPVAFAVETTVPARILFTAIAYLVAVPAAVGLLAPAVTRLLGPGPIAPEIGARLSALASRADVGLGTIRVMPSRGRKVANAAQVGWLPGLQRVVITDYLLDSLTAAEVDAIFAHELGHARGHHTLKRSALASAACFLWACAFISLLSHKPNPILAIGGIAAWALLTKVLRRIVLRQEIAADDVAAELVGLGQFAQALDRVATVNGLKRDTSAKWDRAVGHPGMAIRIARLQAQELASQPDAVPDTVS